ncbi:UDP-glucose 6-dehydrogenase [Bradyrhizobium sp. GM22.5]|nr:hypothetical protein [Bradyrhizobium sp. 30]
MPQSAPLTRLVLSAPRCGETIAVLGLTFKPDTDDMRDPPSIPLVAGLIDMGVKAFDPIGMEQAKGELPSITYCKDAYSCAGGADCSGWRAYRMMSRRTSR